MTTRLVCAVAAAWCAATASALTMMAPATLARPPHEVGSPSSRLSTRSVLLAPPGSRRRPSSQPSRSPPRRRRRRPRTRRVSKFTVAPRTRTPALVQYAVEGLAHDRVIANAVVKMCVDALIAGYRVEQRACATLGSAVVDAAILAYASDVACNDAVLRCAKRRCLGASSSEDDKDC